jgi:hypothetical protein
VPHPARSIPSKENRHEQWLLPLAACAAAVVLLNLLPLLEEHVRCRRENSPLSPFAR